MPVKWEQLYADRTHRMRSSAIREILKITEQPDVISLAGGLPAPELFPVDEYLRAFNWVLETQGGVALQYTTTEGYRPLRELIAERMNQAGARCSADNVLITSGSQQGLDFMGKIFLNVDDVVLVENPTYLGALQAFNQYQPHFAVVPMDEDGMQVDALEDLLVQEQARGTLHRVKFLYAVPNFQNPTGRTLSLERRHRLLEITGRFGIPVVEDDPYGELRYEGEHLPTLKSLDTDGHVIYLGTFSKILAPGWRLAWMVANPEVRDRFIQAKQPTDLQSATAPQMATYLVAREGFLERHVERIKAFYRERRDVMLEALAEYLPADARFNHPQGGLFVWAELPTQVDTTQLLLEAATMDRVAFVAGAAFHADGSGTNTMRLNFSNVPPDTLREGVRRLGGAIQRHMDAVPARLAG